MGQWALLRLWTLRLWAATLAWHLTLRLRAATRRLGSAWGRWATQLHLRTDVGPRSGTLRRGITVDKRWVTELHLWTTLGLRTNTLAG